LKENPPPNSVVLSFDEKGKTPVKRFGGMRWLSGRYFVPYKQKVKALFDLFMVVNLHTGERQYRFYEWKNSFIVIDFFEWLLREVYPNQDVYIILDTWSAHKSNAIKAYIGLQARLHLVYLPTCSSWMNEVERDFSRIQREVLDNSNFNTPQEAREVITQFIEKELKSNGRCS
jgi:transposase